MVVVRRPSLLLVISSIDFFADATAAIPVHSLKCSGFFPLFRKRLTTTFSAASRRGGHCFRFTRQLFGIQVPSEFRRRRRLVE